MTLQHPIMMMLKKKAYDILLLFHVHIILPIGNIEKYLCSDIRWSFNMTWCYNKKGFPLGCCYPLLLISLFIIIVNQQARTIIRIIEILQRCFTLLNQSKQSFTIHTTRWIWWVFGWDKTLYVLQCVMRYGCKIIS